MVCPKCGMKVSGKRSACRYCGAPIPAELGGERPDPIFDDAYDWLRADEIQQTAAESALPPELAPRRGERERLKREKEERREKRKKNSGLILIVSMAVIVLIVLAILTGLYFRWSNELSGAGQSSAGTQSTPRPVHGNFENMPESTDVSFEPAEGTAAPTEEPSVIPEASPEPTPGPTPEPTPGIADRDYIISDSDSRNLTREDLEGLTQKECCLARNEIYARHGRIFMTADISWYFTGKSWYEPTISAENFADSSLNSFERRNIDFIAQYEQEKWGGSYY